jgi:excisionase family DNA binding protein
MEKDDKRWMKPNEVAAYLSVNAKTVYRLLYSHGLPGVKLKDVGWRIDRKRLDDWIEGQMRERELTWRRITSWR